MNIERIEVRILKKILNKIIVFEVYSFLSFFCNFVNFVIFFCFSNEGVT